MKTIAVSGSTGFVGTAAVSRLLADGFTIIGLVRRVMDEAPSQPNLTYVQVDFADPKSLSTALDGCDAVVHIAAHLSMWGSPADFEESNVHLTRRMLDAASVAGVARFVHISAASVIMAKPEAMVNICEDMPYVVRHDMGYSVSKARAEQLVNDANSLSLSTIALRPPFIWGPNDSIDKEFGHAVAAGRFMWFSGGRYPYASVHVDNLAQAVSQAVTSDVTGPVFITDQEEIEFRDFMTRRLDSGGFTPPTRSLPRTLVKVTAALLERVWRLLRLQGQPPLTGELVRLIGFPFRLNDSKARGELGYRPEKSIVVGMDELARRYHTT